MIPYLLAIAGGYLLGNSTRSIFADGGMLSADEWIVDYEKIGGRKMYFLYNQNTGKIRGFFDTKSKAESQLFAKGGRLCPVGTEIQTLIFEKNKFDDKSAKNWAKSHDFKYGYVDEKDNTYRIRQQEPSEFRNDSFRTIDITKGIKAVIGCPKKYEDGGNIQESKMVISLYESYLDDSNRELMRLLKQSSFSEEKYETLLEEAKQNTLKKFDIGRYDYKQEVYVHPIGARKPYDDKYKKF